MYDIRDVLQKGIHLTEKKIVEYTKLQENSGDIRMRLLIGVFIRGFEKDIVYYKRLVDNISDSIAEAIDFSVFDKISSLVNQFSRMIVPIDISDRKELVTYVLEQEKATYALLVDVQGRMVTTGRPLSIAYYVLLEIIDVKRSFLDELEKMR